MPSTASSLPSLGLRPVVMGPPSFFRLAQNTASRRGIWCSKWPLWGQMMWPGGVELWPMGNGRKSWADKSPFSLPWSAPGCSHSLQPGTGVGGTERDRLLCHFVVHYDVVVPALKPLVCCSTCPLASHPHHPGLLHPKHCVTSQSFP